MGFYKYYRWTIQDLAELTLGARITAVCNEEAHTHCLRVNKGCTSVLKGGYTIPKRADRERAAREAQAKCRRVKVTITE